MQLEFPVHHITRQVDIKRYRLQGFMPQSLLNNAQLGALACLCHREGVAQAVHGRVGNPCLL